MANSQTLLTRIAQRTDTSANWLKNDPVLYRGEIAITLDEGATPKIKIGVDGLKKWSEIDYTYDVAALLTQMNDIAVDAVNAGLSNVGGNVFQVSSLDEITSAKKKGDIAIVSTPIAGDAVQYTAYVYDGTNNAWVAMDGNYDATNVYFKNDLVFTKAVGTVTIPASGSTTVAAAGKNLQEVLSGIFAAEVKTGLKTKDPSVSITNSTQYVEVGTTVTPSFNTSFEDGTYKYGPEPTGVTASNYSAYSSTTSETVPGSSGNFAAYTFSDVGTFKAKVSCDTTDGNAPKSNIGTEYAGQKITAKTGLESAEVTLYSSYKPNFYGYKTTANKLGTVDSTTLTSAIVRALGNNQQQTTAPVTAVEIKEKWMQFFYAVPTGRKTSLTAKDSNNVTLGVDVYKNIEVNHAGTVKGTYTVFVINNAAEYDPTTINMTWA